MMRTRVTVRSNFALPRGKPVAMSAVIGSANSTPTSTSVPATTVSSPATAPATRPASSSRPSLNSRL